MKNFLNKIWEGVKEAFWLNVPYIIYSTVWLLLTMFWATVFMKWFVNRIL